VASGIAVSLGAHMIEKHITLDKALPGPDHAASANEKDFKLMVQGIRAAESMLGSGTKTPQPCELKIGRSLVAARNIAAGEYISLSDIECKRPAGGLRAYDIDLFVGARLVQSIKRDEQFAATHIIEKK